MRIGLLLCTLTLIEAIRVKYTLSVEIMPLWAAMLVALILALFQDVKELFR